jgi:hypothetical protein
VARRRDWERDARQRAAEVPSRDVPDAVETLEATIPFSEGDLLVWLQSALETLRDRLHLSTVRGTPRASRRQK